MMVHRFSTDGYEPFVDHRAALERFGGLVVDWEAQDWPDYVRLAKQTAHLVREQDQANHIANVVRLGILLTYGGWWVDWDLTPLSSFHDLPFPATAAHRNGIRCTCWMAFPKQHRVLARALMAIKHSSGSPAGLAAEVSGEQLLDALWGDEVARVLVHRDVDGKVNSLAPVALDHAGRRRIGR
jgi:2-hydroxychromene-2-carboxylate isomerase